MKKVSNKILLGHLICYFAIGMSTLPASEPVRQTILSQQTLNWMDLQAKYDAYINCLSPEKGKTLLNALPARMPGKSIGDAESTLLHIFGGANFPVLLAEVLAGDRLAVEIMVRFLAITDGAYSETTEAILAKLVRSNPKLFLDVLSHYRDMEHIKRFGYPVDFVGEGYESHPCALRHEYEKRIESLESVKDPIYKEIIDSCIKKLREAIKQTTQKAP